MRANRSGCAEYDWRHAEWFLDVSQRMDELWVKDGRPELTAIDCNERYREKAENELRAERQVRRATATA